MADDATRKLVDLIAELSAEVVALRLALVEIGAAVADLDDTLHARLKDRTAFAMLSVNANQQIERKVRELLAAVQGAHKDRQRSGR